MPKTLTKQNLYRFHLEGLPRAQSRGFTLIELLIVITIIMLLAAFIIANVSNARKTSRDGKRTADLSNIQLAMEMYKDSKGSYPAISNAAWADVSNLSSVTDFSKYLSPIPRDPITTARINYGYKMLGNVAPPASSTAYWLSALFEDKDNIPSGYELGSPGKKCYQIWGGTATAGATNVPSYCN